MHTLIFKYNNKIVGVFDDKNIFKHSSFHFILDLLISAKLFDTKKECGLVIRKELKQLYSEPDFTFTYNNHVFDKKTLETNKVVLTIPRPYRSEHDFIFFTDINKPIPMLSIY